MQPSLLYGIHFKTMEKKDMSRREMALYVMCALIIGMRANRKEAASATVYYVDELEKALKGE